MNMVVISEKQGYTAYEILVTLLYMLCSCFELGDTIYHATLSQMEKHEQCTSNQAYSFLFILQWRIYCRQV